VTYQKALKDLLAIAEITHVNGNYSRMMAQQDAMVAWFNKWVVELNASETVLHEKYLTSEYKDLIKERLVYNMVESVTEECAEIKVDGRKTKVKMYALRRGDKP
jgi:hypothetical protein